MAREPDGGGGLSHLPRDAAGTHNLDPSTWRSHITEYEGAQAAAGAVAPTGWHGRDLYAAVNVLAKVEQPEDAALVEDMYECIRAQVWEVNPVVAPAHPPLAFRRRDTAMELGSGAVGVLCGGEDLGELNQQLNVFMTKTGHANAVYLQHLVRAMRHAATSFRADVVLLDLPPDASQVTRYAAPRPRGAHRPRRASATSTVVCGTGRAPCATRQHTCAELARAGGALEAPTPPLMVGCVESRCSLTRSPARAPRR